MDIVPLNSAGRGSDGVLAPGKVVRAAVIGTDKNGNLLLNVDGRQTAASSSFPAEAGKYVKVEILRVQPALSVRIIPDGESLGVGTKVRAEIMGSKDGVFTVRIDGREYRALVFPAPTRTSFMAEVIKTGPLLELKTAAAKPFPQLASFFAAAVSDFDGNAVRALLKMFDGIKITAFVPDQIKKAVRDGGVFFENKLSGGIDPGKDVKMEAALSGNEQARTAVTRLQAANILMNGDCFLFFEGSDDLDFERGTIRIRKTQAGTALYIKVDFSSLGETVLSFLPYGESGYRITIRTEEDLSDDVRHMRIPGCTVRWIRKKPRDSDFFTIKPELFNYFERINIEA